MTQFGILPQDVIDAAYGVTVPSGQNPRIARLIVKAEGLILDRIPTLQTRIDAGKTRLASVQSVVEDMVVRVLRNPNSLRQVGIDGDTATIDQAVSSGQLYLSDDEHDRLLTDVITPRRPAPIRSIRQAPPRWMRTC